MRFSMLANFRWGVAPLFLLTAACNPFSSDNEKPFVIRGISSDLTTAQLRKMEGWEEKVWATTPYGEMPIFIYRPKSSDIQYIEIVKTFLGDTITYSWGMNLPGGVNINHAEADTISQFKSYGEPYIDRSDGAIYLFFGCHNCKEIEFPYCGKDGIKVDFCITISYRNSERHLSGSWFNKHADNKAKKWVEKNRDRINF